MWRPREGCKGCIPRGPKGTWICSHACWPDTSWTDKESERSDSRVSSPYQESCVSGYGPSSEPDGRGPSRFDTDDNYPGYDRYDTDDAEENQSMDKESSREDRQPENDQDAEDEREEEEPDPVKRSRSNLEEEEE